MLTLAVAVAATAAAGAARALVHRGDVLPGVEVLGAEVGGLPPAEAALRARTATAQRLAQPVSIRVGDAQVAIAGNRVFLLDRRATAAALAAAGRESYRARMEALAHPVTSGRRVAPVLVARPQARARLTALLAQFGTPPRNPAVRMRGAEPVVAAGKPGTQVNVAALITQMQAHLLQSDAAVEARFRPTAPPISDAAARAAADEARLIASKPLQLRVRGEPAGALTPVQLARLLSFREHGKRILVIPDGARLARVVEPRVGPWKRQARNAQLVVENGRPTIIPSVDGLGLDARATIVNVNTAAHRDRQRVADVVLAPVAADVTTAEVAALGIREQVSSFTTDMGVSSSNRIHNVHLMADYIDGTIIRPGETFSFNDRVGPRTPERGFREGQMIVGSLLLPSIGGGVCQTATTLFNNAFDLGLPIVERHNHSFYISHYPMGRDATVSWGGPDLKFRNDMGHALLIKSSYTESTLTFTFYGTNEGRKVEARVGPQTTWKEPTTSYALDPAAPPGSVRQVKGEHQRGFDVSVYRTVTKNRTVVRSDSFTSHYIPVGNTAVYGPGAKIPGPYFVIPTT